MKMSDGDKEEIVITPRRIERVAMDVKRSPYRVNVEMCEEILLG